MIGRVCVPDPFVQELVPHRRAARALLPDRWHRPGEARIDKSPQRPAGGAHGDPLHAGDLLGVHHIVVVPVRAQGLDDVTQRLEVPGRDRCTGRGWAVPG